MNILLYLNFFVFFINIIQPKYVPYKLSFTENIIIYTILIWYGLILQNKISYLHTVIEQNNHEIMQNKRRIRYLLKVLR